MKPLFSIFLFALVTLAAYACWAFGARLFGSPAALYTACTAVFLGLGSTTLYPLVSDRCSRLRFFGIYFGAFVGYAAFWCLLWSVFHNKQGEIFGSMIGLAAMSIIFRLGLGRPSNVITGAAILFLWHTFGYHLGELFHEQFSHSHTTLARLGWGLAHGIGFGTGLVSVLKKPEKLMTSPEKRVTD